MFQVTLNTSRETALLIGKLKSGTSQRYPGESLPPFIQAEHLLFIYIDTESAVAYFI